MNKEVEKKLAEIDAELEKLEREEKEKESRVQTPREPKNQSEKALECIKEVTEELNNIEDLKEYRNQNRDDYESILLTIVSWFKYLKDNYPNSEEHISAKELLLSVTEKHPKLSNWINNLIEEVSPEYEPRINTQVELNMSESNEYIVNDDLSITFDTNEVKDYMEKTKSGKDLNKRVLNYIITYKDKEYKCHFTYKDYRPIWEYDSECPFRVTIINVKKDDKGNNIVIFHILTMKLIPINED